MERHLKRKQNSIILRDCDRGRGPCVVMLSGGGALKEVEINRALGLSICLQCEHFSASLL